MTSGQTAVARCSHCRYPFTVSVEHLGTPATCAKCHNAFTLTADETWGRIGPRPRLPGEKPRTSVRAVARMAPAIPALTTLAPATLPATTPSAKPS